MEISVACSDFREGLQQVVNVIPSKTTVPILSHILFEVENERVTLVATDLEISLKTTVPATVNAEGSITIPGRLLFDVVRELPDIPLSMNVEEGNRIILKSSRGQYMFFGGDSKDFPQLPTIDVKNEITLKKEELKRLIEKTVFAVSMDELRSALMGVLFQFRKSELRAISTDGHRLVRIKNSKFITTDDIDDVIVPLKALNLLLKSLDDEGDIKISFADNYITFDLDNTAINAALIDAKYPDYEKVIPQGNNNTLLINREEFMAGLRTISILANKTTQQIKIKLQPSSIILTSQDMDRGEGEETIDAEYTGDSMEIGFNSTYLQEVLKHIDTDEAIFKFGSSTSAALAFPASQVENEDILTLVMPIKLRD